MTGALLHSYAANTEHYYECYQYECYQYECYQYQCNKKTLTESLMEHDGWGREMHPGE